MKFYTYTDFLNNCVGIKRLYKRNLGKYGKIFYKWFIYSNIHTTMQQKNKIWDYINDYCSRNELNIKNKEGKNERNNKNNVQKICIK